MSKTYSDFSKLNDLVADLEDGIREQAFEAIGEGAQEMAKAIKADAPVAHSQVSHDKRGNKISPGTYKRGWGDAELRETGKKRVKYGISSGGKGRAKQASLAHLLEFGHEGNKENGFTRSRSYSHIIKNRDKYENVIVQKVEKAINDVKVK